MNILIAYGGKSCEHDISIITGCLAKGYFDGTITSVYFDKQNRCFLVKNNLSPKQHLQEKLRDKVVFCCGEGRIAVYRKKSIKKFIDVDVAVNCCHGVNGEDGCLSALCQMANIPIVGSNILSSAIAMDKFVCKKMLRAIGAPVVAGKLIEKKQFDCGRFSTAGLKYPVIVKPCNLGSSIGITLCHNKEQFAKALEVAFQFDDKVLCENALTNFYEVNCSAMTVNGKVVTSSVDMPLTANDILTFEDKYVTNSKWSKPSATVDNIVKCIAQSWTQKIYQKLSFDGVIRVDFLVDKDSKKVYVNEINSIPGSLAYGLWTEAYSQREFGKLLIEQAFQGHDAKKRLNYNFNSSVLDGTISKK